ncbi:MAG: energy transducer TonB [Acidobacteriota bacterium]
MTRSRISLADPAAGRPARDPADVTAAHVYDDREDARSFRLSCIAAVLVHLALLCVAVPSWQSSEAEPAPKPKALRLAETPRFKPKPPPPVERRELRRTRATVPVPDPVPDEDPLIVDVLTETELPFDDTYVELPPPPPQAPPLRLPEAAPTGPVRVGGRVAAPERTFYVEPRYPTPAKRARIDGTVVLEATIDVTGRVVDAKVVAGRPMGLSAAALDAVKRWRFEPSTLGGRPVAVLYRVEVTFSLR